MSMTPYRYLPPFMCAEEVSKALGVPLDAIPTIAKDSGWTVIETTRKTRRRLAYVRAEVLGGAKPLINRYEPPQKLTVDEWKRKLQRQKAWYRRNKTRRNKQLKESAKRQAKRNPEKFLARRMTQAALLLGILKRQPCEVCGAPKVEAHHVDYSDAFNIRWLCFRHHREVHGAKHFSD